MTHRNPTQNELIWKMLEEAGPAGCTTADVAGRATEEGIYINRYSARIMELDPDKTLIHREKIPGSSQWRYTLTRYRERLDSLEGEGSQRFHAGSGSPTSAASSDPTLRVDEPSPSLGLFDLAPVSGTKSGITGNAL